MTATFTCEQIISALQPYGEIVGKPVADGSFNICTDSRQAGPQSVYLALKGERFDGHTFVKAAIEAGSPGAIIALSARESVLKSLADLPDAKNKREFFLVVVPDDHNAYQLLATQYRYRINPKVVAVTGS